MIVAKEEQPLKALIDWTKSTWANPAASLHHSVMGRLTVRNQGMGSPFGLASASKSAGSSTALAGPPGPTSSSMKRADSLAFLPELWRYPAQCLRGLDEL